MLHAIRNNKAGRNFQDAVNWRALFGASEDSLTSSVFGHLFYLPTNLFWQVLLQSVHEFKLPPEDGLPKIISYEFWPRWDATDTTNSYTVEPDIFVRTSAFDLIIEAKRNDYGQQYQKQWENQVQAYLNEYGQEQRRVMLLAVGGINNGDERPTSLPVLDKTIRVYKCRWRNLLCAIRDTQHKLPTGSEHIGNVMKDLIASFALHGYATNDWFATLPKKELQQGNSLHLLLNAKSFSQT